MDVLPGCQWIESRGWRCAARERTWTMSMSTGIGGVWDVRSRGEEEGCTTLCRRCTLNRNRSCRLSVLRVRACIGALGTSMPVRSGWDASRRGMRATLDSGLGWVKDMDMDMDMGIRR